MTLTNFNRTSHCLFILISLTTLGCSQQSARHLPIPQAASNGGGRHLAIEQNPSSLQLQALPEIPESLISQKTEVLPTYPNEIAEKTKVLPTYPNEIVEKTEVLPTYTYETPQKIEVQPTYTHETPQKTEDQPIYSTEVQVSDTHQIPQKTRQLTEETIATATAIAKTAVLRHTRSLWKRMFSMYALPDVDHPRVTQEVENFLKHPKSLASLQHRAQPYLYMIIEELDSKQLPGELALLPMIESAFQVQAKSPAEAVGLWQFTPATAVTFGLKQNWWYDGRRDIFASTEAATSYLKKLHKKFHGDWLLALASYNVGARNVQKAINKNTELALDTSFWSLDLPEETKAYVPKLLAIAKIFAHAEDYNLPLEQIPNEPFLKAINIDSQLDLSTAAELAGMPLDEFFHLNPAFNHAVTAPEGSYKLLVKAKNAASFKRKLAKLPKSEHIKWEEHKIIEGEDLNAIATLYDIPVEAIIEINQLKEEKLAVGSVLKLPPKSIKAFIKA